MSVAKQLKQKSIKGEDRYKGIFTAITDYINKNNITDSPSDILAIMTHFDALRHNIIGFKVNAPVPLYVGFYNRTEKENIIRLAVEQNRDIKYYGKATILLDTYRLNHIIDLCLATDFDGKVLIKDINKVKEEKRFLSERQLDNSAKRYYLENIRNDNIETNQSGQRPNKTNIKSINVKPLKEKERNNLHRIIHAMKEVLLTKTYDKAGNPLFSSQNDLIKALENIYLGYDGLSESNLKILYADINKQFNKAERTFKNS